MRGRGAFEAVFVHGQRVQRPRIRCVFVLEPGAANSIRVGFAVPKRTGSAVKRNRIKRLMREAFRREEDEFTEHLRHASLSATLVFVFKPPEDSAALARIRFAELHREISALVGSILTSARTPS